MVRSIMSMENLPLTFWGYALETATYLVNRVPTKLIPNNPYELWIDRKPSVKHLKIWGCYVHVKKQNANKLETRTNKCLFVGYPKETVGYYFHDIDDQKVFKSRNAFFLEEDFVFDHRKNNKIILR